MKVLRNRGVAVVAMVTAVSASALAQQAGQPDQPAGTPRPPAVISTNKPGHPSPPQPQQPQSLDYFVGTWSFSWTGRDSAFGPGARTGTAVLSRIGDSKFLEMQVKGTADGTGAYQESGTIGWDEARKVLVLRERLASGVDVLSIGDWNSPLAIRFDVQPVRADGQLLRLRRVFSVVSHQGFTVAEEISIDGGPFVRLGAGQFRRTETPESRP